MDLLNRVLDTLFIDDISIRKHTVKALEYLTSQEGVTSYLVNEQSGFTSGILNAGMGSYASCELPHQSLAAKDSAKDAIELSALNVLCNVANQHDLQVLSMS